MSDLESQLAREIKQQGEDSPVVQLLRDQIKAEKRPPLHDRWLTGIFSGSPSATGGSEK
jgi:hypothetical protein